MARDMIQTEVNGQVLEFYTIFKGMKIIILRFSLNEDLNMRHCLTLAHIELQDIKLSLALAA